MRLSSALEDSKFCLSVTRPSWEPFKFSRDNTFWGADDEESSGTGEMRRPSAPVILEFVKVLLFKREELPGGSPVMNSP